RDDTRAEGAVQRGGILRAAAIGESAAVSACPVLTSPPAPPTVSVRAPTLRAPLPAVAVGSIIEYVITYDGKNPIAGEGSTNTFDIGEGVPTQRVRLTIDGWGGRSTTAPSRWRWCRRTRRPTRRRRGSSVAR